jgi:hypothetical protein
MSARTRGLARTLWFALLSTWLLVPLAPAWAQPTAYNIGAVPGWQPTVMADGTVVLTAPDAGPSQAWVMLLPVRPLQANFEAQFDTERAEMERTWGLGTAQGVQRRQGRGDAGPYLAWGASYVGADGIRVLLLHGLSGKGVMGLGVFVAASAPAFARHAQAGGALISSLQLSDAARPPVLARADRSGKGAQPWPALPVGDAGQGNVAIAEPAAVPPAPATPTVASGSPGSLSWSVPAGWSRAARGSTTVLTSPPNAMSGQRNLLEVLPAERAQGTPVQTFTALWQRLIGPRFDTPLHPLPLRVRLASGAMLIFDGETQARERASGNTVGAHLYVVTDGVTAVPLIAIQRDWNQLRGELAAFFASARLSGGGRSAPLYTLAEVAGTWHSSSSTSASYVDSAGNYRGDASMATGQTLTIGADGNCSAQFAAIGGGNGRLRSSVKGRCAVEDDTLVMPSEAGLRRYRITGVGRTADHRAGFLLLGITRDDYPLLDASSQSPSAGDVYVTPP